ncbi:MAG: copper resistance protein CopC [Acidimicrobiia bacterium]|nr:copper resistance protein CopC [Acidimicrobiia bacterium]
MHTPLLRSRRPTIGSRAAAFVVATLFGATVALVSLLVTADPAGAHAVLVGSDPSPDTRIEESPDQIVLRFTEPVTADLGGVRLFDSDGRRVGLGSTGRLDGADSTVTVDIPGQLDTGGYVVTWRVVSDDSHPVRGAFTFRVGESEATTTQLDELSSTLLKAEGGSTTVGVLFAVDRAAVFLATTVLFGALAFLLVLWPTGRPLRRTRWLLWCVWGLGVAASLAAVGLQGAFAEGLPLGDVISSSLIGDVLATRFGRAAAARTLLLVATVPIILAATRPAPEGSDGERKRAPGLLTTLTLLVGLASLLTISVAGHATTGIVVAGAVAADVAHLAGIAAWIGGLAVVLVAVLPGSSGRAMGPPVTGFSAMAPWAVLLVFLSGSFQTWRQVGSFGALTSTDYGTILIVKLVVFAVLFVVAAMSRRVLHDRVAIAADLGAAEPAVADGDDKDDDKADDQLTPEELREADRYLAGRFRRLVAVEVVLAVAIFGVTAVLVNAQPARSEDTEPYEALVEADLVTFDILVTPATAGLNDVHATTLTPAGTQRDVLEMRMELTLPDKDIGPFVATSAPGDTGGEVRLRRLAPGHYAAFGMDLPISGDWELTVTVVLDRVDEASATTVVPLR